MINLNSNPFANNNFFDPNAQPESQPNRRQLDPTKAYDPVIAVEAKWHKEYIETCLINKEIESLKEFFADADAEEFWNVLSCLTDYYRQDKAKALEVFATLGPLLQEKEYRTWTNLEDLVELASKDPVKARFVYAPNRPLVFAEVYKNYAARIKRVPRNLVPSDEILALVFGDGFIKETKYEGGPFLNTVNYLISCLQFFSANKFFPETDLSETIGIFQELSGVLQKIKASAPNPESLDKISEAILTTLLETGRAIIPGGWVDKFGGHAMIYLVEREPSSDPLQPPTYSFTIFSTGAGTEYHLHKRIRNSDKILPFETIAHIPAIKIENTSLIEYLLTFLTLLPANADQSYNENDIYPVLFNYFDHTPSDSDFPTGVFSVPQHSGTCTWKVLLAFIRIRLGSSFCEKLKFHLKTFMLYLRIEAMGSNVTRATANLLEESFRSYHFAALRALNAQAISYEEFYVACSLKQQIVIPPIHNLTITEKKGPDNLSCLDFAIHQNAIRPQAAIFTPPSVAPYSLAKLYPSLNCQNPADLINAMDRLVTDGGLALAGGNLLELSFILCPFYMDLPRLDQFEELVKKMDNAQLSLARKKFKELVVLFNKTDFYEKPQAYICRAFLHILNYLLHRDLFTKQIGAEVFEKVVFIDPAMNLKDVKFGCTRISEADQINEFYKDYNGAKSIYFKRNTFSTTGGKELESESYEFDYTDPKYVLYDMWKNKKGVQKDPFKTPGEFSEFFRRSFLGNEFRNYLEVNFILKIGNEHTHVLLYNEHFSTPQKAIFLCSLNGKFLDLRNFSKFINQHSRAISDLKPPLEFKRVMDVSYVRFPLFLAYFEKNINFLDTGQGQLLFTYCLNHYSYSDPVASNFLLREIKTSSKQILDQIKRFTITLAEFALANPKSGMMHIVGDLEFFIEDLMDKYHLGEFSTSITEHHLESLKNSPSPFRRVLYLWFLIRIKGESVFNDANGMHHFLEAYFQEPTNPSTIVIFFYGLKKETARLEPLAREKWSQIEEPSIFLDALCKRKFPHFQSGASWQGTYPVYSCGDYQVDFDKRQILFQNNKQTTFRNYLEHPDFVKISWAQNAQDFTQTELGFDSQTAGLEIRFMGTPVFVRTKDRLLRDFPNCHWPTEDFNLAQEYVFIPAASQSKQIIRHSLIGLDLTREFFYPVLPNALKSVKLEKWAALNGSHMFLKGESTLYLLYRNNNNRLVVRDVVGKQTLVNLTHLKDCYEIQVFSALDDSNHILPWKSDEGDNYSFHLPRVGLTFTKTGLGAFKLKYLNQNYLVLNLVTMLEAIDMLSLKAENGEYVLLLPRRPLILTNQQNSPLVKSTLLVDDNDPDSNFKIASYRFKAPIGPKTALSDCEASKQDLIWLINVLTVAMQWDEAIKVIKKCYQNYPFGPDEQKMIFQTLTNAAARKGTLTRDLSAVMCHLLWLLLENLDYPTDYVQKFSKIYVDYIKNYNSICSDWRLSPDQELSMGDRYCFVKSKPIIHYHLALHARGNQFAELGVPYRNKRHEIPQMKQELLTKAPDFSSLQLLPGFKIADLNEKYRLNAGLELCFLNLVKLFLDAHKNQDGLSLISLQLTALNYLSKTTLVTPLQNYLRPFLFFLAKKGLGELPVPKDFRTRVALRAFCDHIWENHLKNKQKLTIPNPKLKLSFPGQKTPENKQITFNQFTSNYQRFNEIYLNPPPEESSKPQENPRKRAYQDVVPLEDSPTFTAKKLTTQHPADKERSITSNSTAEHDAAAALDASFTRLKERQRLTTSALQLYASLKKDFLEHAKPKEDYAFINPEFVKAQLLVTASESTKLKEKTFSRELKLFNKTFFRVYQNDSTETFRKKVVGAFKGLKTCHDIDFIKLLRTWFLLKDQKDIKPHELEVYEETKQIIHDTLNQSLYAKIIACGVQLLAEMEKTNKSGLRELQHTFHSLVNTKFFSDNQFDPHLPLKIFYQALSGIILRPKQIEVTAKVVNGKKVALQLACGEGKTKVLTALFDLMNLTEQKLVLNVLMPNNFKLNLAEFQKQADTFGVFRVRVFDFHRHINHVEDLKRKCKQLLHSKEFGYVVVTQPKSIQSLGLKYIELLNEPQGDAVDYVEVMLKLIMDDQKTCAIMDEIHQLLKQQDQLNYSLASSEWTPPKYRWQLPVQIVQALLEYNKGQSNPLDIIYFNAQFSVEVYEDRLKEKFVRFLAKKASSFGIQLQTESPKEIALWVKYLCTRAEDLSSEERLQLKAWESGRSPEECERLQLLRAHLMVYLKHTLNARCYVNYGPSAQTHQPVPYKYNMFPEEKNRFEYYDTLVNLTCFMYVKTGLSKPQVKLFLEGWQQMHLNQRRMLADKSQKTAIESRFAKILPGYNLGALNLDDTAVLDSIGPKIAFKQEIIFEFMRVYIFENLATQEHRLNSNAQDLAGTLLGQIIGFSGIFTNDHNFPIDMECKYHPGTYAKILSQLLDPNVTSLACPETKEEANKLLAAAHVYLDPNACHEGQSNLSVAKKLLGIAPSEIHSVLFYNEHNELKALDRQGNVNPYKAQGDNPKNRITFYDHGHHEEVDILQPEDGLGILLVNKNLTFTQLYQAAKRLRGLGAGQRLVLLPPQSVRNYILQKIQEPITMENLIAWTVMNEGEINEKTKLPALLDQLRNVYSSRLMKTLVQLGAAGEKDRRNQIFAENKNLLIEKQDLEHFKKIASLDAPMSDIQTFMQKAKELEKDYFHLLEGEDKVKLGRIMRKAEEELANHFGSRQEGFFNATSQQEHEIQLENQVVHSQIEILESYWDPDALFKEKDFVENLEKYDNKSIQQLMPNSDFDKEIYFTKNFITISNPDPTKKTETYLDQIEFLVELESPTCSKILIVTLKEAEILRRWMILNKTTFENFNVTLYTAAGYLMERVDNVMSDQSIIQKNGSRIFAQVNYLNGNLFCAEEVRESMRAWTNANREYYDNLLRKIQKKQVAKGIRKFITGLDPLYE